MLKIACLLENDFEDDEYGKPAESFKKANYNLIHIGIKKGEEVKGKHHRVSAVIDKSISEVSADQFDVLFIPGGYSPDRLRINDKVVDFVREFANSNKPMFIICHGPQLLITAQVVEGRKMTGWKSIKQDLINAGATFVDEEVVIDNNWVTSRSPADLPAFIKVCLKVLEDYSALRKAA